MRLLEPPDLMHLRAAEGWLGLGNFVEANEELEKITPDERVHPRVLEVRYEVYAMARRWGECVDIAEAMVRLAPQSSVGWIRRSFALHELKQTLEALEKLLAAVDRFPEEIVIYYNLACYECALGNTAHATLRLGEALSLAQKQGCFDKWRLAALEDRDLERLWGQAGRGG
jgi:predicted Zn-dependent protease